MHRVDLIEMLPAIREMLDSGGSVTFTVEGSSMLPTMTGGRDSVTLVKPVGRLNKFDIPLYRRTNGQFVLHRVVKVTESGYIMSGDNQYTYERGITDKNLIGKVIQFTKNGKKINVQSFGNRVYSLLIANRLTKFLKHVRAALKSRLYRVYKRISGR